MRIFAIACSVLLLIGCSSKPVIVEYSAPKPTLSDWFPIPADAPAIVQLTDGVVPKLNSQIEQPDITSVSSALEITQTTDSLGNISLQFNRQPGVTWELVESALADVNYKVIDKDRDNYKFQLSSAQKTQSLFAIIFGKSVDQLNVVLIPQGQVTLVVVEGPDDELPELDRIVDILTDIENHFSNKG